MVRVADTGAVEPSPELKRHERCSRLGLGLLGAGFFLQFLGVILSAWG